MVNTIVFTGGGTAGHVTPNLAFISEFKKLSWDIFYIGSKSGIEKNMLKDNGIEYYGIYCGKLRRYLSLKTLIEPFKIALGLIQSIYLLLKLKPRIVFSKGGFVAFPVVLAAWMLRIPVIAHESDITPGLANKLSYPFVKKICVAFDICKNYFKKPDKIVVTGTPVRPMLFNGDKAKILQELNLDPKKNCLLIMGGSLGAASINICIRKSLNLLLEKYNIIHLCGKGKVDNNYTQKNYVQIEYANENMADLYAAAHIVIGRAGANSVYEILALKKLNILIPLSKASGSRGDQIDNANYFTKLGVSLVIEDEKLTIDSLEKAINYIELHNKDIQKKIDDLNLESATKKIVELIKS